MVIIQIGNIDILYCITPPKLNGGTRQPGGKRVREARLPLQKAKEKRRTRRRPPGGVVERLPGQRRRKPVHRRKRRVWRANLASR
jgi:hypothetical protein